MKEKVSIITGASGEIGQNLILRYSKLKNKKIIAIDLNELLTTSKVYRFIKGSILDTDIINQLAEQYIIEEIFHLAAVLSTKAEKNPKFAEQININGTINLFNLALLQNLNYKIKTKFFFPSSIAVYNLENVKKIRAVKEETYCNPKTVYGKHKLYCENLGISYDLYGNELDLKIDFRCIRFPGIISINSMPSGGTSDYAPEMIHNAFKKNNYTCFVNNKSCLPFIVMPDAIEAIIKIMKRNKNQLNQNIYNITSFSLTVLNLYKLIKEEFPNFKLDYNIDKMRQLIVNSWPNNIDDSNARDQWDWSPKYDLELAFKKYITPGLK